MILREALGLKAFAECTPASAAWQGVNIIRTKRLRARRTPGGRRGGGRDGGKPGAQLAGIKKIKIFEKKGSDGWKTEMNRMNKNYFKVF